MKNWRFAGGLACIISPIVGLMAILSGYAIAQFVIARLQMQSADASIETVGQIINVILGLLGIICVLALFVGIPLGIYLLSTHQKNSEKRVYTWKPLNTMSQWLAGFVGLAMIVALVNAVLQLGLFPLHDNFAFAVVSLLSMFACGVVFIAWLYRASANLHAVGKKMRWAPGWTIGWFFIPFANLVMPFVVVREIVRNSTVGRGYGALMVTWWILWLGCNYIGLLGGFDLATPEGIRAVTMWGGVGEVLTVAAGIPLLLLIRAVAQAQQKR